MKKMLENMETSNAFCDIVKETLEVIKKIDGDFLNKLPAHIKECLYKYSEKSNKIITIDVTKRLEEQNISEECKDLLSIIYYTCIASEDERKDLLKCWNENTKKG